MQNSNRVLIDRAVWNNQRFFYVCSRGEGRRFKADAWARKEIKEGGKEGVEDEKDSFKHFIL